MTIYQAKGLEWSKVKLGNDFQYPNEEMLTIPQEEVNILYVAATRAINILDISDCDALKEKNLNFGSQAWQEKLSLKETFIKTSKKEINDLDDLQQLRAENE